MAKSKPQPQTLTVDTGVFKTNITWAATDEEWKTTSGEMDIEGRRTLNLTLALNTILETARRHKKQRSFPRNPVSAEELVAAAADGTLDPEVAEAWVNKVIELHSAKSFDGAIAAGIFLGRIYERMLHREKEPHARRGQKTLLAASQGGKVVHGERQQRNREIAQAYAAAHKPGGKVTATYRKLAKQFGVSDRTIRRAVKEASEL